jgi:hypothetical protein
VPFTFDITLVNWPLTFIVTGPSVWTVVIFYDRPPKPFLTLVRSKVLGVVGAHVNVPSVMFTTQRVTGKGVVSCRCALVDAIVKLLSGISLAPWIKITRCGSTSGVT